MRLIDADLPFYFDRDPMNIGVLLGPASNGLVDIDLDSLLAVELAREFLPQTGAIFGRRSKLASHWLYYVDGSAKTEKFTSNKGGTIAEIRYAGAQTVFPGSTHPSGELVEWVHDGEPARISAEELREAVAELVAAVRASLDNHEESDKAGVDEIQQRGGDGRILVNHQHDRLVNHILQSELATVQAAAPGTRNDKLNTAAFTLGRLAGGGHCDASETEQALLAAANSIGLGKREALATVRSGIQSGIKQPRRLEGEVRAQPHQVPPPPAEASEQILIDTDEHRVVSQTIQRLTADPDLYQRGTMLVRVLRENCLDDGVARPIGSPIIQAVPGPNLRERMTRVASFKKVNHKGERVSVHPPQWLASAIEVRGEWAGIRVLRGVSDAPVLRPNGTVWQVPGYDAETGVLYEPSGEFPHIDIETTLDDAVAARDLLQEVVRDFTFESEEHKAAWFAGLLTGLARFAYDGPSPLFLIDANVRGAGKGLLAQTIARIVLGREMPVSSYSHDAQEMRKRITAIAIAGDRMVLLDNLEGAFGNDALDRALTTTRWKDRILGRSEEIDLPLLSTWYATGNNVAVAADTARRIIHVRLDVLAERPEERTGFQHPNLIAWIAQNRPQLLTAAMKILSAYCRAGRPSQGLSPFGSFEGWSGLVREAVVWVGLPDPCLTRIKLAESADTTGDNLAQLISAWQQYIPFGMGVVIADMLGELYPSDRQFAPNSPEASTMRAALENLVGCPPGKAPTPRQVGTRLSHFRRRVMNGKYLDGVAREGQGTKWRLCTAE